MKKLFIILLSIISLFPMILNASENEKEVKYKFYKEYEDNIHYEFNPEEVCLGEIIDYDKFVYSDYIISSIVPEERNKRVIESFDGAININADYVDYILITSFENILGKTSDMRKVELFDSNGEKIPYIITDYRYFGAYPHTGGYTNEYPGSLNDDDISESVLTNANSRMTLKLDRIVYLKDLTIKVTYKDVNDDFSGLTYNGRINNYFTTLYASNYTEKTILCDEENICVMTITTPDYPGTGLIELKTKLYKYKDPLYKCYSKERVYMPGYYNDLEGFIKDEEKYIVETKNDDNIDKDDLLITLTNLQNDNKIIIDFLSKININDEHQEELLTMVNNIEEETITEEIQEDIVANDDIIAMKDAEVNEVSFDSFYSFLIIFGSLSLILSIILYIKSVKNSRTK